jgi:selenocysteine-specific elongation factor
VHRRRSPSRHAEHLAYLEPTVDACCAGLLKLGYFSVPAFSETWQLTADALQDLLERHQALLISENAVSKQHLAHLAREATAAVQEATDKDSSFTGLKENAFVDIPAAFRTEVLTALVQNNRLQYAGGLYTLPGHRADLPERLAARWQRLEPALDLAQAPSTGDLAKQWRVPQAELEADMKELTRRGLLVHVAKHRFYLPGQLEKLATTASELATEGPFNVRGFGDATGVGRNIAIEVLEYFDARGFTRRQGNTRILMKTHL